MTRLKKNKTESLWQEFKKNFWDECCCFAVIFALPVIALVNYFEDINNPDKINEKRAKAKEKQEATAGRKKICLKKDWAKNKKLFSGPLVVFYILPLISSCTLKR